MKILNIDWNELRNKNKFISIIEYVEENEEFYQKKYYESIERIGNIIVDNGENIYEKCQFKSDYNLWQMSSIQEKSFFKTPQIFEHIKILALLDLVKTQDLTQVNISGINRHSASFLTTLETNTTFYFQNITALNSRKSFADKFFSRNQRLEAFFWITYQFFKKLKSPAVIKNIKTESSIFIIDYFAHLNENGMINYSSNIWDPLLNKISKRHKIYFFHHFIPTKKIKSLKRAAQKLNKFNLNKNQVHDFIELNINFFIFSKVIFNYILFQFKTQKIISSLKAKINNHNNSLSIKFLNNSILSSLTGKELIQNILYVEIFDDFFKKIKYQKIGIYLQENQGWEFALINAWKKNKHGKLLAFNAASISNWDMRFAYPFEKDKIRLIKQKMPDFFLVGSKSYKLLYNKLGYELDKVHDVEALRYIKLQKVISKTSQGKILIMGSITTSVNELMIKSLEPLLLKFNQIKWYFKPHPASTFKIKNEKIHLLKDDLIKKASELDFVICPSDSSVVIDCYLLGLNFIVFLKKGTPNTSPLKDIKGVKFAYNNEDVSNFIFKKNKVKRKEDFFNLDNNLNNWKLILNEK